MAAETTDDEASADFAIAMASLAHPDTRITGHDLSEGMLEVMSGKVKAAGLGDMVSAMHGNSESMDFDDDSFDRVSIGFGIRNFENRETALREILRVLRPGGKLVILELSIPEVPVIRGLYKFYFLHILPWIGGRISGDEAAYRYLPASVVRFPRRDEWMQTMRECGYNNVCHKAFTFGICRMYIGEK